MNFNPLKVENIQRLTANAVKITFDVPESLQKTYQFTAGQYITLAIKGERRDYSLCVSPRNKEWSIAVKATADGYISKYLANDLKVGDILAVAAPNGRFVIPSRPSEKRTLLAFVAGSGITPIMSIVEYTLQTEKWVNFHLFFVNKSPQQTMFKEQLAELKQKYPENIFIYHFYTQKEQEDWLFNGRMDAKKFQLIINQLVDINEVDEVLICGPEEMIFDLANEVFITGIPKKRIHFELFTTNKMVNIYPEEETYADKVKVTVHLDGETHQLTWKKDINLIDALLDEGIDAPYSCKGGICSSCMCKKISGEVILGENFILTEKDIKNNFILPCISRPKTDVLEIDFDV